jgi:hypothetical protein
VASASKVAAYRDVLETAILGDEKAEAWLVMAAIRMEENFIVYRSWWRNSEDWDCGGGEKDSDFGSLHFSWWCPMTT